MALGKPWTFLPTGEDLQKQPVKDAKYYQSLADSINSNSKANFVSRLKEDTLRTIPNWEDPKGGYSSHKLSYVTGEGGKAFVYPNVQEINGELHDFTDPKYKHGKWDAWKSALDRKDYVEFSNPEDAAWFSDNNYKQYYKSTQDAYREAMEERNAKK